MPTHEHILEIPAAPPITTNPNILGGTPVIAGTRVPVSALYDYLADGLTLDYFLESFPSVPREKAVRILRSSQGLVVREALP